MERKIVWNRKPTMFLAQALKKISEDSLKNAEIVEELITASILGLNAFPEKFPPDRFKKNNSGTHRAFEVASLRVSYKVTPSEIRILRIRHVKQVPKEY